jgi:hypothetical protein
MSALHGAPQTPRRPMGDIAPQVPLAIDAVRSGPWPLDRCHGRTRRVGAVHDRGPGLHQPSLSKGSRRGCRVSMACPCILKEID